MKYAVYQYAAGVAFSAPVRDHAFLIRCTPQENACQRVVNGRCSVSPLSEGSLCRGADSFGNVVHSGTIPAPHDFFQIETAGEIALFDPYLVPDEHPNPIFRYESAYTAYTAGIRALWKSARLSGADDISRTVEKLAAAVYEALRYEAGATDTRTTAGAALALGKGVCQDFAHILIALCRLSGIAARYAAGFVEGEGSTHAWVEYHENGAWKAADPTHNRLVQTGCVKLSHGRDFEDCAVERGVFTGIARQTLSVRLRVSIRDTP
jgi:transglutaminase-like putative cysteine protease